MAPIRHVGIIGAGISGVNTAAHLLKEGLDVTVFERAPVTGGVWVFSSDLPYEPTYPSPAPSKGESTFYPQDGQRDPALVHSSPSPAYEGLKNNVPTQLMEVSLNKWKPGTEPFVNHTVLAEYIQETAAKTGVTAQTVFDTRVTKVWKDDDDIHWNIEASTLNRETKKTTTRKYQFDAVVVASGHYHAPKVPNTPGLAEWKQAWPYNLIHAKGYRNPDRFAGKTVLLIGGSASSMDIASEVAPVAKKVWQSTRGGLFDQPATMLPEGATRVGQVVSYNKLTSKDTAESLGEKGPHAGPIPGTVTLEDGQEIGDIDYVVVATGYQFSLPFLEQLHKDKLAPADADDTVLVTDGQQLHNLHKDIFYIPDPTLSFVGVPFYTATFSLFEWQAIAVAAFLAGKAKLPPVEEQRAEYRKRVEKRGFGKPFHSLWGEDIDYARDLMKWVNSTAPTDADRKPEGYSPEWIADKERLKRVFDRKNTLHKANQFEWVGERGLTEDKA